MPTMHRVSGSLLILAGLCLSAPARSADKINADPYYEASYCVYTASAFKDKQTAQGWTEIAADIARGGANSAERLIKLDQEAFDWAPLRENDEDRPDYERCRKNLALIRQQAQAAPSPVNEYAPARAAWYDRSSAAIERDPAKRTEALSKIRAWDAYCLMSGHSLSTMIAHNPAAFGLNPQKPDHAKLAQAVVAETAKFKSQFEKDFSEAERKQMQGFMDPQRENYRKAYEERKASDKAVAAFSTKQVFVCSEGFEQLWAKLAR